MKNSAEIPFKNLLRVLILFISVHSVSAISDKAPGLPLCPHEVLIKEKGGQRIAFSALPKALLLGRSAEISVQGQDLQKDFQIQESQSFLAAETKVLCASTPGANFYSKSEEFQTEIQAPVLLDLTQENSTGNSVWTFRTQVQKDKVISWNTVSKISSLSFSPNRSIGAQASVEVYQVSHDQFRIDYFTETPEQRRKVSVLYDMVNEK